jgi:hypothetical protein
VITLTQSEEEGIYQAWNRFNELIEQGPRLGFSGDALLHTFIFSLTLVAWNMSNYVQVGISWRKHSRKPLNFYKKISKAAAVQRDWKRCCREEQNDKSKPETLAEISEKDEPKVEGDELIIQEIEEPLPKVSKVISDIKNVETNMNVGQSMRDATPLAEFNISG